MFTHFCRASVRRRRIRASRRSSARLWATTTRRRPRLPRVLEVDEALSFALADEAAEVRAAAARALGVHVYLPAISALSRVTTDEAAAVRGAAVRALGALAVAARGEERAQAHAVLRER